MYVFDAQNGKLSLPEDSGRYGMNAETTSAHTIRDDFVRIKTGFMGGINGVLYQPQKPAAGAQAAVVVVHSHDDYSTMNIAPELAKRGYRVFAGRVQHPEGLLDEKLKDIAAIIRFLKSLKGINKVILMGHSGGATLMTAYQRAAENGVASLKTDEMLFKCTLPDETVLERADGLMLLDANYGNGAQTLLSIDPCVTEEGNGRKLDMSLDIYQAEAGYSDEKTVYTEEFKKKFYKAQAARNNRMIEAALARLKFIEEGQGNFMDDEPLTIAGGAQIKPFNKLYPEDLTLLAHTKGTYRLLHGDGSFTSEQVPSLRDAMLGRPARSEAMFATLQTTVKAFLCEHAVRALEGYGVHEDGVTGIDWDHTYNCPPGNVKHIHVPLLISGMTGSCEFMASEAIYENAASEDKEIFFTEAADHNLAVNHRIEEYPGQYGDVEQALYNQAADWLERKFVTKAKETL